MQSMQQSHRGETNTIHHLLREKDSLSSTLLSLLSDGGKQDVWNTPYFGTWHNITHNCYYIFKIITREAGSVNLRIEHLLSICEALGLVSSTTKKINSIKMIIEYKIPCLWLKIPTPFHLLFERTKFQRQRYFVFVFVFN
jgi:hypothetical protein